MALHPLLRGIVEQHFPALGREPSPVMVARERRTRGADMTTNETTAKTATIRPIAVDEHGNRWEVDLSDRPAGWPMGKACVSRERLERFLVDHGYACTFVSEAS